MYYSKSNYSSLSALFIDNAPDGSSGSMQILIQQPNVVRTALYENQTGAGSPKEIVLGDGKHLAFYAPGANVQTTAELSATSEALPLDSLPLTVAQSETGPTAIPSGAYDAGVSSLADMLIHPMSMVTSTFFKDKSVDVLGRADIQGRTAWILNGKQVAGTTALPGLGDAWRMWVDSKTGIVLRLEYLSKGSLLGWAELRDLSVDKGISSPSQSGSVVYSGALPEGIATVSLNDYMQMARVEVPGRG
jgi:outer membrane lipoprotein-sorting protein